MGRGYRVTGRVNLVEAPVRGLLRACADAERRTSRVCSSSPWTLVPFMLWLRAVNGIGCPGRRPLPSLQGQLILGVRSAGSHPCSCTRSSSQHTIHDFAHNGAAFAHCRGAAALSLQMPRDFPFPVESGSSATRIQGHRRPWPFVARAFSILRSPSHL